MSKIRKSYRILPGVIVAIRLLAKEGYSFPSDSETSVIEKAVQEAWQTTFLGQEFPKDEEVEVEE